MRYHNVSFISQSCLHFLFIQSLIEIGQNRWLDLPSSHLFCPISIETMGAMGPRSLTLVKEVGRRIMAETGEAKSTDYLLQRLSIAVQRGNCASVLGGMNA